MFIDLRCQSVFAEGRIRPCRAYRVVKSIWSNIMLIRCRRQSNQLSDLSEYKTEVQTAETHILPQPCALRGCPNPDVKPFSFLCLCLCFIFFLSLWIYFRITVPTSYSGLGDVFLKFQFLTSCKFSSTRNCNSRTLCTGMQFTAPASRLLADWFTKARVLDAEVFLHFIFFVFHIWQHTI